MGSPCGLVRYERFMSLYSVSMTMGDKGRAALAAHPLVGFGESIPEVLHDPSLWKSQHEMSRQSESKRLGVSAESVTPLRRVVPGAINFDISTGLLSLPLVTSLPPFRLYIGPKTQDPFFSPFQFSRFLYLRPRTWMHPHSLRTQHHSLCINPALHPPRRPPRS